MIGRKSILMLDITRHRSIFNPSDFTENINIIGCGATGSWMAMCLSKIGVMSIDLWDFDKVEDHNVANQIFKQSDIGRFKVDALKDVLISTNEDMKVSTHNIAVSGDTVLSGFVFVLTDTMKSRKEIYNGCIKYKPKVKGFIETRMGVSEGQIYTINSHNLEKLKFYEATLMYDDDSAEVSACGTSITVLPTALGIVSTAIWQFMGFVNLTDFYNEIIINYKDNDIFKNVF